MAMDGLYAENAGAIFCPCTVPRPSMALGAAE
jgi:hypothetical protein